MNYCAHKLANNNIRPCQRPWTQMIFNHKFESVEGVLASNKKFGTSTEILLCNDIKKPHATIRLALIDSVCCPEFVTQTL